MWNPEHKDKPIPLKDIPIQRGSWEYSELYRDVMVAKEWNLDPMEFWSKPRLSRLFMIAYCEANATMESFEVNKK